MPIPIQRIDGNSILARFGKSVPSTPPDDSLPQGYFLQNEIQKYPIMHSINKRVKSRQVMRIKLFDDLNGYNTGYFCKGRWYCITRNNTPVKKIIGWTPISNRAWFIENGILEK